MKSPDAIHHHASGKRIGGTRDGFRQLEPAAPFREPLRRALAEYLQKSPRRFLTEVGFFSPDVDPYVSRMIGIFDGVQERILWRQGFFERGKPAAHGIQVLLPFPREPTVDLLGTEIINAAVELFPFACVRLGREVAPQVILFDLQRFETRGFALLGLLGALGSTSFT